MEQLRLGKVRRSRGHRIAPSRLVLLIFGAAIAVWGRAPGRQGMPPAPVLRQTPPQDAATQNDLADQHVISVVFDYDFQKNPSCAEKPALKSCVQQFVVYDISVQKSRLFAIPVPDAARGLVKVNGQSPSRIYLPGRHRIAVTAQNAEGAESPAYAATFIVEVKPKPAPAAPAH